MIDDDEDPARIEEGDRLLDAGEEAHAIGIGEIVRVLDDRTVAVEEDRAPDGVGRAGDHVAGADVGAAAAQ